jgi:Flp pilus assembly protein TadG
LIRPSSSHLRGRRPAAAAVELAVVLPLLALFFFIAVDYSRIFYSYSIVSNCARNGAFYACDPMYAQDSPYQSVQEAALADAGDLSPTPTVTSAEGKDADGHAYVEVSVSYPFKTVTNYLGLGGTIQVERTVRMRKAPLTPESGVSSSGSGGG